MRPMFLVVCLMVLLASVQSFGQITISNTFAPSPGTEIQNKSDGSVDETFFNSMISGNGGPMLWDFTGRAYGTLYSSLVVSTAGTPGIATFPNANLVFRVVNGTDTIWSINRSTSAVFWRIGVVSRSGSATPVVTAYQDTAADYVFPIAYNNQWTAFRHWTQNPGQMVHTDIADTIQNHVDAYGSVKYGSNSVPVLRVILEERYTYNTYNNGTLINTSTTNWTTVNFMAAGNTIPVSVWKIESFGSTTYGGYADNSFLSIPTDAPEEVSGTLPADYTVEQNYPNPFNPSTTIEYGLPTRAQVTIDIFNVLGEKVRTLVNETESAGTYRVEWNGRNDAWQAVSTGVYLYRVQAGDIVDTRKMLLLK